MGGRPRAALRTAPRRLLSSVARHRARLRRRRRLCGRPCETRPQQWRQNCATSRIPTLDSTATCISVLGQGGPVSVTCSRVRRSETWSIASAPARTFSNCGDTSTRTQPVHSRGRRRTTDEQPASWWLGSQLMRARAPPPALLVVALFLNCSAVQNHQWRQKVWPPTVFQ